MESIKDIFIEGPGPSSSHTIGPAKAAVDFRTDLGEVDNIIVTLCGSLALTGKGHSTDTVILKMLSDYKVEIVFDYNLVGLKHPNTVIFKAFKDGKIVKEKTYLSVGGGKVVSDLKDVKIKNVYPFNSFNEIKKYSEENHLSLVEIVNHFENSDINAYFENAINVMFKNIEANIKKDGILPGSLKLKRVSKSIYENSLKIEDPEEQKTMLITAFAYACLEGNASGDIVVTAPTCGSCGIVPSLLYFEYKYNHVAKEKLIDSLKVAGLFGNVCKKNASISGAVLGCQAEVGVASLMASAALAYIHNLSLYQIEYASEVALEHFLGLTCDPVDGYVQIPCIERNGIGALHAYNSYLYAKNIAPVRRNKVSFDDVVLAMKMTGESLNSDYKETSIGGLAKVIK